MQNFIFKNPTEILFGRGMIVKIAQRVPQDKPVLVLYGGGSIKHNGVYDQVKTALRDHGKLHEFGGIEANPLYETCLKAVALVREKDIGFILAAGGGSVLDAAKFIAVAAAYDGEPWDILSGRGKIKSALPIGSVLTLPATGSEANGNSVISRRSTQEKLAFGSPLVFPAFSVLDPATTFSLPEKQVRNGIVDSFMHVMEQYMTYPSAAPLQDRFAEGVVQTLIEVAPKALAVRDDYESRAAFMWSATLALNTLIGAGVPQDWSTHGIGHELTAFYGLDHAETLAIILPGVWRHQFASKKEKLEQYGKRVWNVDSAEEAIAKTEEFLKSIGMPVRLADYNIDAQEAAEKIRARFAARGTKLGERGDIGPDDAAEIVLDRA
jgi:NADP-dependent alcohol dehydrogenase